MIDQYILDCMKCFPRSFINYLGEVILEEKTNSYICLSRIDNEKELKAAVLEYLSRAACKTDPYPGRKKNDELHTRVRESINRYLGTTFTEGEMWTIYDVLGNGVKHSRTLKFIDSGYDVSSLM